MRPAADCAACQAVEIHEYLGRYDSGEVRSRSFTVAEGEYNDLRVDADYRSVLGLRGPVS